MAAPRKAPESRRFNFGSNLAVSVASGVATVTGQSGGGGSNDGVVDGATFDSESGELTLSRSEGSDLTVDVDEILRVASGDTLPAAADNEERVAVSGNALFESRYVVTEQAHDRSVTLMTLPVGGVTISGTVYGNNYAGNFAAAPLATNYSLNEFIWDRGSEVWLLNATSSLGARHWLSYSGPAHFRHGVYYSDANAGSHANGAGEIFIVGSGSSQLVRYVSSFTAATAEQSGWVWQHLGTTFSDVEAVITGRLSGNAPPAIGITGNAGSSTDIARADHHHLGQTSVTVANAITARLSDDTPGAVATVGSSGTGSDGSREDHRHAGVSSLAASEGLASEPDRGCGEHHGGSVERRAGSCRSHRERGRNGRNDLSQPARACWRHVNRRFAGTGRCSQSGPGRGHGHRRC